MRSTHRSLSFLTEALLHDRQVRLAGLSPRLSVTVTFSPSSGRVASARPSSRSTPTFRIHRGCAAEHICSLIISPVLKTHAVPPRSTKTRPRSPPPSARVPPQIFLLRPPFTTHSLATTSKLSPVDPSKSPSKDTLPTIFSGDLRAPVEKVRTSSRRSMAPCDRTRS